MQLFRDSSSSGPVVEIVDKTEELAGAACNAGPARSRGHASFALRLDFLIEPFTLSIFLLLTLKREPLPGTSIRSWAHEES